MTAISTRVYNNCSVPAETRPLTKKEFTNVLSKNTFTIVEQQRSCFDKPREVITEFLKHTIPSIEPEFIEEHLRHRVHNSKPYVVSVANTQTHAAFISYIGLNDSDSTFMYCLEHNIATNPNSISINHNGHPVFMMNN